jgi:hypothetical protein
VNAQGASLEPELADVRARLNARRARVIEHAIAMDAEIHLTLQRGVGRRRDARRFKNDLKDLRQMALSLDPARLTSEEAVRPEFQAEVTTTFERMGHLVDRMSHAARVIDARAIPPCSFRRGPSRAPRRIVRVSRRRATARAPGSDDPHLPDVTRRRLLAGVAA